MNISQHIKTFIGELDYWTSTSTSIYASIFVMILFSIAMPICLAGGLAWFLYESLPEVYLGIKDGLPKLKKNCEALKFF